MVIEAGREHCTDCAPRACSCRRRLRRRVSRGVTLTPHTFDVHAIAVQLHKRPPACPFRAASCCCVAVRVPPLDRSSRVLCS